MVTLKTISGDITAQDHNDNYSALNGAQVAHEADTTPHSTIQSVDKLGLTAPTTLTISAGEITITQSYHTVDTEASAATDDLDTILGGGNEGEILVLRQSDSARDITIKNGAGNILTYDRSDIRLDSSTSAVIFIRVTAAWYVIGVQGLPLSAGSNYTLTGKLFSNDQFYSGSGSPEGSVTARIGSIYQRSDGGASTTLYVKESGTGNTGWVAK